MPQQTSTRGSARDDSFSSTPVGCYALSSASSRALSIAAVTLALLHRGRTGLQVPLVKLLLGLQARLALPSVRQQVALSLGFAVSRILLSHALLVLVDAAPVASIDLDGETRIRATVRSEDRVVDPATLA